MTNVFQESWFYWAIMLAVGFPLLAIFLGQVCDELNRQHHPLLFTVRWLRNLLLPLTVFYLLLAKVVRLADGRLILKIMLTLILITAVYLLLSLINGVLFGSADTHTWRAQTPRLLRELVIVFLVALAAAVIFAQVWEQDLAGLVAALGLGSVVLGFALQGTLGNVISGITLLMERPFSEGDWVEIGDIEGKVTEINWRAIRILNRKGNLVVLPHTMVAQETLVNNSAPDPVTGNIVEVGFSYSHPPNQVKQMLKEALGSTPGILAEPQPVLRTLDYGDSAITYQLLYWIVNQKDRFNIRERLMTRIWYGAQRHDLNIPFPIRTLYHFNGPKANEDPMPQVLEQQTDRSPIIHELLDGNILDEVGQGANLQYFGRDEQIIAEGERSDYLYIMLSGQVKLTTHVKGNLEEIMTLGQGEFFGAIAVLSNQPSPVSITALEDATVLRLTLSMMHQLIDRRPSLALEIGQVIELRQRAIQQFRFTPPTHQNRSMAS